MSTSILIISEVLILAGAIIMLFAIFKTRNILKLKKLGKNERNWKILVSLMIFFFLGYITTVYIVFLGAEKPFLIISGSVFLLGALFVYLVARINFNTLTDLGNALKNSMTEIDRRVQSENKMKTANDELSKHNEALLSMAKKINVNTDSLEKIIKQITELGSEILSVERVSVWYYNELRTSISCSDLYEASKKEHSSGTILQAKDYPLYFKALEENRVIDAHNAHADPRTIEYSTSYLTPLGINSMLDVVISDSGKTDGIICFEHVGPIRTWSPGEIVFANVLAYFISLAIEVYERRIAEEKLQKSEERFRTLSEASFEGIAIHYKGKILETNAAFAKLYGYTESEIIGLDLLELVARESKEIFKNNLLANDKNTYEVIALRKDKTVIYVEIMQGSIDFKDSTCGLLAVRDLTWKKKAEEEKLALISELKKAKVDSEIKIQERTSDLKMINETLLKEMEERKKINEQVHVYKDIVKNIPIGILMFEFENIEDTKSLKVVMANPAAEIMGEAKVRDFVGKYLVDFSPDSFKSGRDKIYQEVVKSGEIRDLGIIHYKGSNIDGATQIPENYFHFVAFPLPKNSVGLSLENVTEQVKAEARFERVVEASPFALLMVDKGGKITLANLQAELIYGYSRQELLNADILKLVPERFHNEFMESLKLFFKAPDAPAGLLSKEGVGLKKDRSVVPITISFSPVYTKTGIYLLVSIADINERKKAEEQIKLYENIVINIPIGLNIMKFENLEDTHSLKLVATNPAFDRYFSTKGIDLKGKYAIDFSSEIFKNGQDKIYQKIVKTGQPQDFGTIHHSGNGQPDNYIHMSAFPIPENYIAISYENITEQIKTEERFRLVVEAAPIAMIVADKIGKISIVNSQAEILFAYNKEELKNMDFGQLFPEENRKEYLETRRNFFENPDEREKIQKLQQIIQKKDGTQARVEISFIPIYSGNAIFMLASIPEESEGKKQEEKIIENKIGLKL